MKISVSVVVCFCVAIFSFSCGGLTDKQKAAAEKSISELRKLEAATQLGVTKGEYSKMLIIAQAAATEAGSVLPDGALKMGIADTAQTYADANTLWNIMKDDDWFFACIKAAQLDENRKSDITVNLRKNMCPPENGELTTKYNLPKRDKMSGELSEHEWAVVYKKEGLSVIWKAAREKLNRIGTAE